jgi:hypothetical protein
VPLTAKLAGDVSFAVQVPWNPNDVLPPGLIAALNEALVAVTT